MISPKTSSKQGIHWPANKCQRNVKILLVDMPALQKFLFPLPHQRMNNNWFCNNSFWMWLLSIVMKLPLFLKAYGAYDS